MLVRFSCVAFVKPTARIGLVGSIDDLGCWDPKRCIFLYPYTLPTDENHASLWYTDVNIDIDTKTVAHITNNTCHGDITADGMCTADSAISKKIILEYEDKLIKFSKKKTDSNVNGRFRGLCGDYSIHNLAADEVYILQEHPLRSVTFEYKFISWNENTAAPPYTKDSRTCNWFYPPPPSQNVEKCINDHTNVIWEGSGSFTNRKFVFNPLDICVHEDEHGKPKCIYLCNVMNFSDYRVLSGEASHTSRYYSSVKSEGRMDFNEVINGVFVGTCPRTFEHVEYLKNTLQMSAVFSLQTAEDIKNNFTADMHTDITPQSMYLMYEKAGISYVWMPVEDMNNEARAINVAQSAVILQALIKKGHRVYVHCNAGVGRSVAAVCALLCFVLKIDIRKTNFLMSAKRPVAYWDENAMMEGLKDFEKKFEAENIS